MVSIICLYFSRFIIKSSIWNDLKRINWRQRQKTLCKLIRRVHRTATSPWSRFLLLLNFSSLLASLRSRSPSHFDCRIRIIPWNCLIFGRRNRFRGLLAAFAFSVACDGKRPLGEEFLMIANLVCLDHLVAGVSEVLSEARIETSFVQTFFSPHHKAQIREKLFLAQNSREFNT